MRRTTRCIALLLIATALVAIPAWAQDSGTLTGRLTGAGETPLSGVLVEVEGTQYVTTTEADGSFRLTGVPPGTYNLAFSSGDNREVKSGVEVKAGTSTRVEATMPWDLTFLETIDVVVSASRRAEKITEAPAAVTVIEAEQVEREAAHGQLPKLLEFTPGAEVTQSGVYDYNFNTRGFNSSLNRRVAVLIDGREPSVPFLGAQEWAAVSFPLDDLAAVEMVRGPSAALYGANASSGVLNLVTKNPKDSQGGQLRLTAGELKTVNGDFRWATEIGGGWYAKVLAGANTGEDFTTSRTGGRAEYARPCPNPQGNAVDCLPQEVVPLAIEDDNEIAYGAARIDKHFGDTAVWTVEGGYSEIQGPVFQTGIGRVQLVDVQRPWGRTNFNTTHFNVLAYWNGREGEQLGLSSGAPLFLDEENWSVEGQTNWEFLDGRGRFVAGASYSEDDIDSANPAGRQTLTFAPITADFTAAYGQVDFEITDKLKLVVAGRWDDSSLYDSQVSPKASLVWGVAPNQSVRLSYNEAFQVANYSEFFLQADVAAPVNLSAFEAICAQARISCGFNRPVRVLAVGNDDLELEETTTYELGYTGLVGSRVFLTADYYRSENENFITDLVPQLGTSLGRINSDFGAYTPPANLPPQLAAALLAALGRNLPATLRPLLTNNLDGSPAFVARSYTNFGEVDTQGIDIGVNVMGHGGWRYNFTYSWFDFDIKNNSPEFANLLLPNSPEHKAAAGVAYLGSRFDVSLSARWVDTFRWVVGPFQGDVDSYVTADLGANYNLNDNWRLGINIANVTDDEHWESFGGDLLGRRALGHVSFGW
jgi:outer membrane receptor for ferrienterochelin and colicins